jgi:hypothetical protein
MTCTIVTAFYPIKSKFPLTQYVQWATQFLQLKAPIVLFTTPGLVYLFKAIRGDRPIQIIEMPFAELDTWRLYQEKWKAHHALDPEKDIHSPELYAVWAQKAFFVERTISINPFNTEYFFWCDIGAFRDPSISRVILDSFPTTQFLSKEKLLLQAINPLPQVEKRQHADGIWGPAIHAGWNECRLVGGLWGGGIKACLQWKDAYQKMLETYFSVGRFAGKDQAVMLSTYMQAPELADIVRCTKDGIDNWFFLQYLLSAEKNTYLIDKSYL